MDGRIISVQRPSEAEEVNASIMAQMYRDRLTETNIEIEELERMYREQRIGPENFAERWHNLQQTKEFLERELHRMGF